MNKKEKLYQTLQSFTPEIIFQGTIGGIKLIMQVDAFAECVRWIVCEGDYCTNFRNFQEACDYYIKAIGEE